ncbi:hemin ABC transporter substrate-binding protein [Psychromonas sp. RZ22]|uniref:heme/hemin ABC transporter substrate-binding protein n=1 Tax=Psychromonas algarum TaxID=2555643 RepID=UPI001068C28C|nr:hemin ABC transporter substrate-binding protein [Psychromonas sp. RZ22]TEW54158.1 hemin ABC transporter substrate-binding protein [Psychromonas sp. RZ22]
MKSYFNTVFCIVLLMLNTSTYAAERIISAGGAVTELIYALGASSQLVAVDVTSVMPAEDKLPSVGYHRQLSAEGILSLSPTMLIGSEEMGPYSTLKLLKQANLPVHIINSEATVTGLLQRVDQLAELTHEEANSKKLKQGIKQQVTALQATQPKQKKRILFLMMHEGRPANVAGANTTANTVIELIGGVNPAAEHLESYKPLAQESLIEMQPDVILISQRSYQKFKNKEAILLAFPMLAGTPAGKNKALYSIDGKALIGGLGLKSLQESSRLKQIIYSQKSL